jgi:hypothetical protein
MAKRSGTKKSYGDPVYTWAFRSSQARGGQIINYETRLEEDGTLRCNCPGWVFCKTKDKNDNPVPKTCTHTRQVEDESRDVLRRFKRGETLEVLESETEARTGAGSALPAAVVAKQSGDSRIKYGRVIEI